MADKTNYLVSHFFVSSDYFLQFESLRDFAFRGGCCSTVLAKVNGKTNADLCLYKQVTSPPNPTFTVGFYLGRKTCDEPMLSRISVDFIKGSTCDLGQHVFCESLIIRLKQLNGFYIQHLANFQYRFQAYIDFSAFDFMNIACVLTYTQTQFISR